jgi:LacI family transcriptional regulator
VATIYDVARLAGVSPATVSRVFNGTTVTPENERVVREAAEQLDFVPNRTARTLRRRSSDIIALLIPDIENPYFTALARGVEDTARSAGYSVVLCNTDDDIARESDYLDVAVSEHMAGVIIAAASDQSDLSPLLSRDKAVVAVDRVPHGASIDAVTIDNAAGAQLATRLLVDRGYRRIACIAGPDDVETSVARLTGWRDTLTAAGLPVDESLVEHADYRVEGGSAAMERLLARGERPDAVFVANNLMSVGALRSLRDVGIHPPAIGIASFGALPFSTSAPTGVSMVSLPARELGAEAARLLLARIGGDRQEPRTIVLEATPIG